ncbi:MAG: tRNA pseudouridine(55) synthase TruB, partial [Spirochaetales bacterium]|nr:tRNA pseudouridine(55) synthase TruB [Spirochaetales bacterium]
SRRSKTYRGMTSGILFLNKPTASSSAKVLNPVKRRFHGAKVGHTGTLDPFAEGLLVVLIGPATRLSRWFLKLDKRYRALVRVGEETDTLDPEGSVIARAPIPERERIITASRAFHGTVEQMPPAYSALKVNGERAYELARRGESPGLSSRPVVIYDLSIEPTERSDEFRLAVHCGSGTYIRSLARDIAREADTRGHLRRLTRSAVGPFSLDEACTIEELTALDDPAGRLISVREALVRLGDTTVLPVTDETARYMRNGTPPAHCLSSAEMTSISNTSLALCVDRRKREVALLIAESRDDGARTDDDTRWRYAAVFPGDAPEEVGP